MKIVNGSIVKVVPMTNETNCDGLFRFSFYWKNVSTDSGSVKSVKAQCGG